MLARRPVAAFNVADFHRKSQHACQAERHALGVFVAVHGHFEAVAKVNVDDLASDSVEHQVGWMSVAQTKDISDHGHDSQRARVIGSAAKPCFRTLALEP